MSRRKLVSTTAPTLVTDKFVKFDLERTQLFIELENDKNIIKFIANVPLNSYFSIGFGSTMTNTDMILWQA